VSSTPVFVLLNATPIDHRLSFPTNNIEKSMFETDSETFSDTRAQLHWASQLLSAAADAKIEKAKDDSHSNLAWNPKSGSLEGRVGVSLDINRFAVEIGDESLSLNGKSLNEAAVWLGQQLEVEIKFRDYEMPDHPVGKGQSFSPNGTNLQAMSQWFTFGQEAMAGNGELRVWPHHFDLGFWKDTGVEGKSIGGGFALGDHFYDEPYFYINPYGIDRPDAPPQLTHGAWTKHWVGAVLTASELEGGDPGPIAKHFIANALELSAELLK
jgi:hypothetical protein